MEDVFYNVENNSLNLLRFYNDGIVLGAPLSSSVPDDIPKTLSWFNKENYNTFWSKGAYSVEENKISFDLTSISGKVLYIGKIINENELHLNSHSLINGHKAERIYKKYNTSIQERNSISTNKTIEQKTKKCPYCGEQILEEAIKCRYCNEWLNKQNTLTNVFNKAKTYIKEKRKEIQQKRIEHLFTPTEDHPIVIRDLRVYPERIEYLDNVLEFENITTIYYYPSIETLNFITTRFVFFTITGVKEKSKSIEGDNIIKLNIPKLISVPESKFSKKEFEQLGHIYELISLASFENRVMQYLKAVEDNSFFIYDGFEFHQNGDIKKDGRLYENLNHAKQNNLIVFGSAWRGLYSSSSNPFELVFLSGNPRVKILGFETGCKFKIDTIINHDVFKILINYFLKYGSYLLNSA